MFAVSKAFLLRLIGDEVWLWLTVVVVAVTGVRVTQVQHLGGESAVGLLGIHLLLLFGIEADSTDVLLILLVLRSHAAQVTDHLPPSECFQINFGETHVYQLLLDDVLLQLA